MRISRSRASGTALLGLAAAGALTTALLAPVGAAADDSRPKDRCEDFPALSEADRLAGNCVPGNDIARMDDGGARLDQGDAESSRNVRLLSNIPKKGSFATESALNSDLAFSGRYAFAGNYNGFTVYDLKNPAKPRTLSQVVCPGSQNDISVYGDLLVLSTDSSRSDDSCESTTQSATIKDSWEGIKVFDISDPRVPEYVAAVETPCGSHTHTLAPKARKGGWGQDKKGGSKGRGEDLYVYVSSYSPSASFPDCQPPLDSISIVKIPTEKPEKARLLSVPVLFPDGGNPGNGYTSATSGCHDLTAYPSKDLMAGACMGDGILLDISDREKPVVTESVRDDNFAFWHSATFNNDATKVVFTDELGGGGAPTCNETVGPEKGANGIYDITRKGELQFKSYYKIPRTQTNTENCVAHNGSLVPVKGKDIMVQAWYQGGWSMFDFTDSAHPKEIAWFDRGPYDAATLKTAGAWSTYYYNGYIYSNEIQRGFDTFQVKDRAIRGAEKVRFAELNPQSQPRYRE
jgi:hypothetical protein